MEILSSIPKIDAQKTLALISPELAHEIPDLSLLERISHYARAFASAVLSALRLDEELLPRDGRDYPGGFCHEEMRRLRSLYGADEPGAGIRLDSHTMGRPSFLQDLFFLIIQKKK